MTRRREARRLALSVLYESDIAGRDPRELLEERVGLGHKVPGFARELVEGVAQHRDALDRLIGAHAEEWTVPRMAAVDRAVLRLGAFEVLHREDVPDAVAIDEAVSAVSELSTEGSGAFVNGILGHIAREHEPAG